MIIMAVDPGTARTGLAVCDAGERLASPAGLIAERSREKLVEKIIEKALSCQAAHLVVGLPRNMDGSLGESAQAAQQLAEELEKRGGIPVSMQDERGTTITAHRLLGEANRYGKKRKKAIDELAAILILEDFLKYRKTLQAREEESKEREEKR